VTLVLRRSELRRCVDLPVLVEELAQALAGYTGDGAQRLRTAPSATVTGMVLAPGLVPGIPAYTVKVHAKAPERRPAITGVICLHDLAHGDLLAVLDSGWLTAMRTGAGAALGAHGLAPSRARAIGVIGAGVQGRAQFRALWTLRRPASVQVHDAEPAAAASFADEISRDTGLSVRVRASAASVAADCDILLVATWSHRPVLTREQVRPGTHITSLGGDEPGKTELDAALLAGSLVVTDDERLARSILPRSDTTLPAVLRGEHPGRTSEDQITVYSPVGLPLQDCVVAWHAYERARRAGAGLTIDLEQ
jgi:ornithine cyclodeaminase/alanine dehydrogenase-like protein (mu-crystallin family)